MSSWVKILGLCINKLHLLAWINPRGNYVTEYLMMRRLCVGFRSRCYFVKLRGLEVFH